MNGGNKSYLSYNRGGKSYIVDKSDIDFYCVWNDTGYVHLTDMRYSPVGKLWHRPSHILPITYRNHIATAGKCLLVGSFLSILSGVIVGIAYATEKPQFYYAAVATGALGLGFTLAAGIQLSKHKERGYAFEYGR